MIDKLLLHAVFGCYFLSTVLTAPSPLHFSISSGTESPNLRPHLNSSRVEYGKLLNNASERITNISGNPISSFNDQQQPQAQAIISIEGNGKNQFNPDAESIKEKEVGFPLGSTPMSTRRNKKNVFFCCLDDPVESTTTPYKKGKNRERNTKPPDQKRSKERETAEEPYMERRPALLLRFFPDGTAVLISKFQLHLHVKPKQIMFDPDEDTKSDEGFDYDPDVLLNPGNSYEVTYKRLEASKPPQELTSEDLQFSEQKSAEAKPLKNSETDTTFVTESSFTTDANLDTERHISTLRETTTSEAITESQEVTQTKATSPLANTENKTDQIITPTLGDSPFFIMTSEEMSSLQQQYDPMQASPLRATTAIQSDRTLETSTVVTTEETDTMTLSSISPTPSLEDVQTLPPTTTTKCLSFKNQLSLVLSTEDNIDNSLLRKQILPTRDCNNSDEQPEALANFRQADTTVVETTSQLPTTMVTTRETSTPTPYTSRQLPVYHSSQLSKHPSRSDVVVVTSLPVLIDLKSARNNFVTDVPAWKEVTVGVVRDQQGQPLKPRYNNWTAHLRSLRKKNNNKFWADFTTPATDLLSHQRAPIQQNFQHAPSQINRSFWTDLQRHRPAPNHPVNLKSGYSPQAQLTIPPVSYRTENSANDFQFWKTMNGRNTQSNDLRRDASDRWQYQSNGQVQKPGGSAIKGPLRSTHRTYESQESLRNRPWNAEHYPPSNRQW